MAGGGGGGSDTGVIFPQFYSAEAQMSDADVFSDSRAISGATGLKESGASRADLLSEDASSTPTLSTSPTGNPALIGLLDAPPS